MIVDVSPRVFKELQPNDPHPFVSESFINLNSSKAERIVRLVDIENNSLGLIAGIHKGELKSPFTAPFGGFHYRHEQLYINEVNNFVNDLVGFAKNEKLNSINITLPPDIYHLTLNAKLNSVFLRSEFRMNIPEITNWVDLSAFQNRFNFRSSREYYNQSVRKELDFQLEQLDKEKFNIYEIVKENRSRVRRPMYMSFADLKLIESIWSVDYFSVKTPENKLVAGAILYRAHPSIVQAIFWGDSEEGRPMRAMDFLLFNLWVHYKEMNYRFIDLGISTESGIPNGGLLRFKETHECTSSLRFSYSLKVY